MIEPIRAGVLVVEGAADNIDDEIMTDDKIETEVCSVKIDLKMTSLDQIVFNVLFSVPIFIVYNYINLYISR